MRERERQTDRQMKMNANQNTRNRMCECQQIHFLNKATEIYFRVCMYMYIGFSEADILSQYSVYHSKK